MRVTLVERMEPSLLFLSEHASQLSITSGHYALFSAMYVQPVKQRYKPRTLQEGPLQSIQSLG